MKSLMFAAVAACAVQGSVFAQAVKGEDPKPVETVEEEESGLVPAFGLSLDVCSRQLSYGLADNPYPILTPHAEMTFLDTLTFYGESLMDLTDWGHRHRHPDGPGYGDRRWKVQEFDFGADLAHSFSADDYSFLPTTIDLSIGYMYEYHPRFSKGKSDGVNGNPDTQFINFEIGAPDLWLEPVFAIEYDCDRDEGLYFSAGVGHTFDIIEAREGEEDAVFDINVALAQGLGSDKRNEAYLEEDHWGLMDTSLTVTFDWRPLEWLTVSPYVAYYEYIFDSRLRDAARDYCYKTHGDSYQLIGGITVEASF